jgi:hypothetical protein
LYSPSPFSRAGGSDGSAPLSKSRSRELPFTCCSASCAMVFVRAESMLPPEERGLSLRLGSGVVSFWAVDIARTGGTVHVQTILPLPLLCICTRTSTARTTSVAASDADDQLGYIRRRRCTSAPQRCVKIHNVIQYAPRPTPPPPPSSIFSAVGRIRSRRSISVNPSATHWDSNE